MKKIEANVLMVGDRPGITVAMGIEVEACECPNMDDWENVGQWENHDYCTCILHGATYGMRTPCPHLKEVTREDNKIFVHCE